MRRVANAMMTVVGDDIENSANIKTLLIAAAMFGAEYVARAHAHLARPEIANVLAAEKIRVASPEMIRDEFHMVLALENAAGAEDIYSSRSIDGDSSVLVVGNERRGVSREMLTRSDSIIQIPMASRTLNSLNVAASTAVALYYLVGEGGGRVPIVANPEKRRPALLLLAPTDHVELGSSIRSAAAFGWMQLLVEDQHTVWFGVDRGARAEGRAAARRARNAIRVIPSSHKDRHMFDRVDVVIPSRGGTPLSKANLANGPGSLLVIPDSQGIDIGTVDLERFGRDVHLVTLDIPYHPIVPRYRLDASVVLAEAARQIGRPRPKDVQARRRLHPRYDRSFRLISPEFGDLIDVKELERY
jgi:tRNA G18 (ribose-2'-O)-methylase SpoU